MQVRIRFAKYGFLKFIGHLDIMRYFQKAIRRSQLPVKYSEGFNPHQVMSFALPLGIGDTSEAEYMDIELIDDQVAAKVSEGGFSGPEEYIFTALSGAVTEGFTILSAKIVPEPEVNVKREVAMAIVSASDYLIQWKDDYELPFEDNAALWEKFGTFIDQPEVNMVKKTKKTETALNLKEYIYAASPDGEGFKPSDAAHAQEFENDLKIYIRLSAGSVMNIKPELVLTAFYDSLGLEFDEKKIQLHRMELYRGEKDNLRSL